jgi:hypothetical protein
MPIRIHVSKSSLSRRATTTCGSGKEAETAFPAIITKEAETAFPAIITKVKTVRIPRIKNQKPKDDPYYPAGVKRAKEAVRRLQETGIIDAEGRRIRQDLPPDMQKGQDRDFGG